MLRRVVLIGMACGLVLGPAPFQSLGQDAGAMATVPYECEYGFEDGIDPVRFWLSYGKAYTVNSKGITAEKSHTGKHPFKLDVTFKERKRPEYLVSSPQHLLGFISTTFTENPGSFHCRKKSRNLQKGAVSGAPTYLGYQPTNIEL